MIEKIISKIDTSLLKIKSVMDYLEDVCKNSIIISEDIENDNGEINIMKDNELVRIVFISISVGKWWSIYRYHSDKTKYEQVDVMIYDEIKSSGANIVIKYSSHLENEFFSYINCSTFSYLNEDCINSWSKKRVVPIDELRKIQYCKDMNLSELIFMTDNNKINVLKKENIKNIGSFSLKLVKVPNEVK